MTHTVSEVSWEPDGTVYVTYLDDDDIRCEGAVALRRTARIVPTEQYVEGVQRVVDAAQALLDDVLGDWETSEPYVEPTSASEQPLPAEVDEPGQLEGSAADRNWRAIEQAREQQS